MSEQSSDELKTQSADKFVVPEQPSLVTNSNAVGSFQINMGVQSNFVKNRLRDLNQNKFSPSPYNSNYFVGRSKELELIISILQKSESRSRAIIVEGERGTGKSWLLLHLHRTLSNITSWYLNLWDYGDGYRPWGQRPHNNEYFFPLGKQPNFSEFLYEITQNLAIELPQDTTLSKASYLIRNFVEKHSDKRFVLFLDSTYEGDWAFLETLESRFLDMLLTLPNFFVIIAGRGRPYPWRIPSLIEATHINLAPFTLEEVFEQRKKFNFSSILPVKTIYGIGNGLPLFTEFLVQARDHGEAVNFAAEALFAIVPAHDRTQLRNYFEALCALSGFGELESASMVEAYNSQNGKIDGRSVCRKMNESRLVNWKNGRYEMDTTVQKILRQYLILNKPDDWIRLNSAAYRHFRKQRDDRSMERFRLFFQDLMNFHAQALIDMGIDSDVVGKL